MSPRNSSRRRGFGIALGALRDRYGMKQEVFAKWIGISRPLLASLETGNRPPSDKVMAALATTLPDEDLAAIEAAAKPYRTSHKPKPLDSSISQRMEELARRGELDDMWSTLMAEYAIGIDYFDNDLFELANLCMNLNDICQQLNMPSSSKLSRRPDWTLLDWAWQHLVNAYAIDLGTPSDKKPVGLWERLFHSYSQHGDLASSDQALEAALERYSNAGNLWYLLGMSQLEMDRFRDSYASLTMAATNKASRLDVIYARGLLLTYWEKWTEAIFELNQAIKDPQLDPQRSARARSARAYARHCAGSRLPEDDFPAIEQDLPDNAWLYYYWGLREQPLYMTPYRPHESTEREKKELARFARALTCKAYPLTNAKVAWVKRRLAGDIQRPMITDTVHFMRNMPSL